MGTESSGFDRQRLEDIEIFKIKEETDSEKILEIRCGF